MEERIINYLDMSEEQREFSLSHLKDIGFCPAYGKEKTMKRIMDKSVDGELPQFYFVYRKEALIGYLFIIGDTQKYRAFPWLAVSNEDELPISVAKPLMEIHKNTWEKTGNTKMANFVQERLNDCERGIGRLPEDFCR